MLLDDENQVWIGAGVGIGSLSKLSLYGLHSGKPGKLTQTQQLVHKGAISVKGLG